MTTTKKYERRGKVKKMEMAITNKALFFVDKGLKGTVAVPEGVEKIDGYAFSGCNKIERLIIPNSVVAIGPYAFSNCGKLTVISLPNDIETIEIENAFYGCDKEMAIIVRLPKEGGGKKN